MRVMIFGATGMVGQSVIRECLADPQVTSVVAVGRTPTGIRHEKFKDLVKIDLWHLSDSKSELKGFDGCFFCLGVSTTGVSADEYKRLNYELPLAVAKTLASINPEMAFVYVSGAGTDSTEKGRVMWARVKGATENALLALPFQAYMFRPGIIQPLNGVRSKTFAYKVGYFFLKPFLPLAKAIVPKQIVTSEEIGRAMIKVVRDRPALKILESPDIWNLGNNPVSQNLHN